MEKSFSVKINAPEVLEKQLKRRAKKKEYGILLYPTEPYQAIEKETKLTRKLLEIILKYRFHPYLIKSTLALRDLDLLKEIDERAIFPEDLKDKLNRDMIINFSFSTLNENLAEILELEVLKPKERLKIMNVKRKIFV